MSNYWKLAQAGKLGQHPLGAEYPDWPSDQREVVTEKIKKNKGLSKPTDTVVIHEGLVLDGWQRLQCCLVAGIAPRFARLARGKDPAEYVEEVNDHRRHEDEATIIKRAERRRQMVAGRAAGKSYRQLGEEHGVSEKTARRDVESSGAAGGAAPDGDGKVTGKDGKKYDATKLDLRCGPCKRKFPPGQSMKDCPACEDVKTEHRYNAAHKTKGTGRKPRVVKAGGVLFDWESFDSKFGALVRMIDKLGDAGKFKNGPECEGLRGELAEFRKSFKAVARKALKGVPED